MSWILEAEGRNFRNYRHFSVSFDKNFNIFYGLNGQGKTSLLEALLAGLRGCGFHPGRHYDFIRSGESAASVNLKIKEEEGESSLSSVFQKNGENSGASKQILYCGKKTARSFLEKKLPVLVFTADKLEIIKKDDAQRRAFIDELLVFQGKGRLVKKYKACFQQKNSFLFNCQKEGRSLKEVRHSLEPLNENFLEAARALTEGRIALLEDLFQNLRPSVEAFFPPPAPRLGFVYSVSDRAVKTAEEAADLLKKDLNDKTPYELKAGRVLTGPHRGQIKFLFQGRNSRTSCSAGQQRLFILTLMASRIDPLHPPFLFLDDVLSEMDEEARQRLLEFLERTDAQIFLTSCKKVPQMTKKMSSFFIKNGIIGSSDE